MKDNEVDLIIERGDLRRQRSMLSFGLASLGRKHVSVPDYESKQHFFDAEIRKLTKLIREYNK